MKRALLIANFNSFHRQFNIPYIYMLNNEGYKVSLVSGGNNEFENIDTQNKYLKCNNCNSYSKIDCPI